MNLQLHSTDKKDIALSLTVFSVLTAVAFFFRPTPESGDSTLHYLFARYAFEHPVNFLNHWAKPVFTLLAAPFAQFGFGGIMMFNILLFSANVFLSLKLARHFQFNQPWLVVLFLVCAPLNMILAFSGLTEYLFAFGILSAVFSAARNRLLWSTAIVSFLPFIRSEGLLVIGVWFVFLLMKRQWKLVPLLALAHVVFAIAGSFYYADLFWVFNRIPYASLSSPYGQGSPFDFFHRLNYVIEKPIYFLLLVGGASWLWSLFTSKKEFNLVWSVLVVGTFLVIFLSHALFWWLGIFNSMGLPRVLISVVPLVALIALSGVNKIHEFISARKLRFALISSIWLIVIIFPFTPRSQGVVFNASMFEVPQNHLIDQQLKPWLADQNSLLSDRTLYYTHPYLSLTLEIDPFDPEQHHDLRNCDSIQFVPGSLVIWDSWFSVIEDQCELQQLQGLPMLKELAVFQRTDRGEKFSIVVFVVE